MTLLERTPRGVRRTPAGQVFLEEARRVLLTLSKHGPRRGRRRRGHQGTCASPCRRRRADLRLSALLALCREEAPERGIRLFEAPLSQVVGGLGNDLYDAALAMTGEMDVGVVARPVGRPVGRGHTCIGTPCWRIKRVPLEEVVRYPLVLCHPQVCEEYSRQYERLLRQVETRRSWPST